MMPLAIGQPAPLPAVRKLEGHTGSVMSVTFSRDGAILVSGSRDKSIRVWDAKTAKQQRVLKEHTADVYSVAFAPDGKTLASGSADKTIRFWDVSKWQVRQTLKG